MLKDSLKNSKNSNQEFEFCAGNQYMSKNEVKCTKSSHGCTSRFLNFFGTRELIFTIAAQCANLKFLRKRLVYMYIAKFLVAKLAKILTSILYLLLKNEFNENVFWDTNKLGHYIFFHVTICSIFLGSSVKFEMVSR